MYLDRIAAVAVLAVAGLAAPALASNAEFRVLPYQQWPTTDAITLNWFGFENVPGTLTITGPGLGSPLVVSSSPQLITDLDYQYSSETNPAVSNDGRVYFNGAPARNYKHSLRVTGLQPGAEYTYSVQQGASSFSATFSTAPTATDARRLRFAVLSDSETLVSGRTRNREWARTTPQTPESTGRPAGTGIGRDSYLMTETFGYQQNLIALDARDPDMIIMPGDLIEGTATEQQRRWDEFWRHNAGAYDDVATKRPIVAAIGNNCIFAGTGTNAVDTTNARIQFARKQWSAYWDFAPVPNANMSDLYHRQDYGPVTILTLCVVKAVEEANHLIAPPQGQGLSVNFPANRDTNRAWFNVLYPYGDMPDFNQNTEQWNWAVQQLEDARAQGRIIFVQWHHTPFSRGVHGSAVTSNQSGEATRIYAPLMEQYRVAGVFTGHSEVLERSFFDLDNDGYGVNLWDVGAAGDGLRGVEDAPGLTNAAITAWRNNPLNPLGQAFTTNPYHQWSADQSFPETWNGNTLLSGGKHYGFLEVDLLPLPDNQFRIAFQPYHVFPINQNFVVSSTELRKYNDQVILQGSANNLLVMCSDADLDGNPGVDFGDFLAFFNAFDSGSLLSDIDASGTVDFTDFTDFFNAYNQGC